MLKVEIVQTGSRAGNCAILDNGQTVIMIDIGHQTGGWKAVAEDLRIRGYEPGDINALLITHKHGDHTKQLNMFLKNHPLGSEVVYTSENVALDIDEAGIAKKFYIEAVNYMKLDAPNMVGTFDVTPRKLSHGGLGKSRIRECIGFEIYDTVNDKWILFATDTSTLNPFKNADHEWDLICVESNYEEKTLEYNYFDAPRRPEESSTYIRTKEDHMSVERLTMFVAEEGVRCPIIELHESGDNKINKFDKNKYSQILWRKEEKNE